MRQGRFYIHDFLDYLYENNEERTYLCSEQSAFFLFLSKNKALTNAAKKYGFRFGASRFNAGENYHKDCDSYFIRRLANAQQM